MKKIVIISLWEEVLFDILEQQEGFGQIARRMLLGLEIWEPWKINKRENKPLRPVTYCTNFGPR